MKSMKNTLNKQKWELLGGLALLAIFVVPFLTFASSRNHIYVDASANGTQNGSIGNPYATISEALVHANDRSDVHVAKGIYEDNIEIPKGVKIFGSDVDEVIVRAKSSRKVVVSMKDNTEINKLTIEKGREGVWVKNNSKVSIIKCVIKNNDRDGIKIGEGSTGKKEAVSITDSKIKDNGRSGIYSQKHRLVLMNNEISGNDSDGVDIAKGSSAWIEGNSIKDNRTGMKLVLDGSDIWTKNNTFRSNKLSGLEVNAFGKSGRIDFNKAKFIDNKKFGVARNARADFSASIWNGLTVNDNSDFISNNSGNVSGINWMQDTN